MNIIVDANCKDLLKDVIVYACNFLPYIDNNNYFNLFINALMVGMVSVTITFILNYIFFNRELKSVFNMICSIIKRRTIKDEKII